MRALTSSGEFPIRAAAMLSCLLMGGGDSTGLQLSRCGDAAGLGDGFTELLRSDLGVPG